MQQIRESILKILSEYGDDDNALIAALSGVAKQAGNQTYPVILQVLTNLEMDEDEAVICWRDIIGHRALMAGALGRQVNLRTVLCDYFCSIQKRLKNPKVVEMEVFEKNADSFRLDDLTGLFSRGYFDQALEREVARARRYDTDVSLLFLDLDDFKSKNDTYGHPAGDRILQEAARIIRIQIRTQDTAARYGGDEFVIIMPHTGKRNALIVAERIRSKIELKRFKYDGTEIRQTISGGLASFPPDGSNALSLVKRSDKALYRAKKFGKNMIALYTGSNRRHLRRHVKKFAYQS